MDSTAHAKPTGRKPAVIIIGVVLLLALVAVFYFFILPASQASYSLLSGLSRAYMLANGLTINMDGSADEFFWLRGGFDLTTDLASAPDGKGRPVGSDFTIAFERWQTCNITLELGLEAQPMCRKIGLKVNDREVGLLDIAGGYQSFSIPIADSDLRSGGNIATFTLSGDGQCAATVDYIRFRLGKATSDAAPSLDQRLIGGVKTDVLGTSSPCEMNFYAKAPKNAHLSFTLGHDKEEGNDSPGWLRIWCQGEKTAGKLLWEGGFPVKGQRKLDLELGNQPDEIVLLSFYIKPEIEDWLYIASPELLFPKPAEKIAPQPAPLVMDKSKPRTIVLIFEDAMRQDMLPVYGNKFIKTPNLDEIAKSALVFENCYAPSNWTLPSFSSVFTSQPFTKTGIVHKNTVMVDGIPTLAGELGRNGWETAVLTSNVITGQGFGVSRGYQNVVEIHNLIKHGPPIMLGEYLPYLHTCLANTPQQKDLLVTLHLMDTHDPYSRPDQYMRYYDGLYDRIVQDFPWVSICPPEFTPEQFRDKVISTCSSITYFDSVLPELIQTIGKYRDPSNTVFILLSDHGEELSDHGKAGHGSTLYQESIHIPLLVWGDGVKPGRSAGFVNSIDLMPTILEMANVAVPPNLEGVSFAGPLRDDVSVRPRIIFSAMQMGPFIYGCAIDTPWKLLYMKNTPELFNLMEDPKETHNLAAGKPVVFGYMRGILWEWWRNIHAGGIAQSNQRPVLSLQEIEILRGLGYVR